MKQETYETRMERVREAMESHHASCFLVGPSASMRYLCGYAGRGDERLLLLVLTRDHKPFLIANRLYELQVSGTPVETFVYWSDGEDAVSLLAEELRKRGVEPDTVAIDKSMPAMFSVPIMQRLPGCRMVLGNELVDPLRVYKDGEEMEYMTRACHLAALALENTIARGSWWIGKTESDFRDTLCREMTRQGLNAHGAIVAVGANAAIPHHTTGGAVIEKGSRMLVDYGANLEGYCSDMTRTFQFGEPSAEPGIYLPGKFGVRIEDQALIREDGLHILHDFSRELRIMK